MKAARLRPAPYVAKQVSHEEILKLDGAYLTSMRPAILAKTIDYTLIYLLPLTFPTVNSYRMTTPPPPPRPQNNVESLPNALNMSVGYHSTLIGGGEGGGFFILFRRS